jgi:hypothetical protein
MQCTGYSPRWTDSTNKENYCCVLILHVCIVRAKSFRRPMIASTVLCLPIHIAMTYFLVFRTSLAFTGAALATALSNWTLLLSLIGFTRLRSWHRARQYSALPQPFVQLELTGVPTAGGASGIAGAGTGLPMAASDSNADAFETSESSDLERFRGGGSALSMHGVLSPEDEMMNGGSAGSGGSFAATLRAARRQTNYSLPIDDGGGGDVDDDDALDHEDRLGFAINDDAATRRAARLQSQFSLPMIGGGGSSGIVYGDDDDDDHDDDDNRLGFAMDDDDDLVAMATGAALGVSPIASPAVSPRSRSLQFSPPSETPFSALMSPSAPSLSSAAAARSSSARRSKSSKRTASAGASFDEDSLDRRIVASETNSGDTTVDAAAAAAADAFYDAAAENTWPPLSCDVFRGWGEFFRLGAPAALSLIIEWGSYEVTAWAAGRLGATSLATHTVFMQTCGTSSTRVLPFHLFLSTLTLCTRPLPVSLIMPSSFSFPLNSLIWQPCGT